MWLIILSALFFLSAVLIKWLVPKEKLEDWAHVTSIVGGIGTAVSLLWAAYTFYEGAQLQKELAAYNIYQEHMKFSIEHPDLSNPRLAPKAPGVDTLTERIQNYEKYRWYVGHALFSFESILDVFPEDTAWKRTAGTFIKDHGVYIRDSGRICERFSENIKQLAKDSLGMNCPD